MVTAQLMHTQHITVSSQHLSLASTINALWNLLSEAKPLFCLSFCAQFQQRQWMSQLWGRACLCARFIWGAWTWNVGGRTHTHTLQSSAFKTAHNANPDKVRLQVLARSDKNAVTGLDRNAHFPPCTWWCVSLSRHVRCIQQPNAQGNLCITYENNHIAIAWCPLSAPPVCYKARCNTACIHAHCSGLQWAHTWPGVMAYWCGESSWKLITRGRRHNVVSVFPADCSYLSATFTQQSPGFAIVDFKVHQRVVNYSDVWNFGARCVNGAVPRRSDPGQR